ncbi:hypothetical protein RUM43_009558 [Polyplax serrata]|uniref:Uncharacterized protein n=1 Tax=Polyplax serrata TaxID=468196 RepID=A0AAN8NZR1_POLSC
MHIQTHTQRHPQKKRQLIPEVDKLASEEGVDFQSILVNQSNKLQCEKIRLARAELLYDHNATKTSLRIKPLRVTDEAVYKCDITYIKAHDECPVVQLVNVVTRNGLVRISRWLGNANTPKFGSTLVDEWKGLPPCHHLSECLDPPQPTHVS